MPDWLKALFSGGGKASGGTITRTCKLCGKTFTLPEEVQHWPDTCQACRAKYRPAERITRQKDSFGDVARICGIMWSSHSISLLSVKFVQK